MSATIRDAGLTEILAEARPLDTLYFRGTDVVSRIIGGAEHLVEYLSLPNDVILPPGTRSTSLDRGTRPAALTAANHLGFIPTHCGIVVTPEVMPIRNATDPTRPYVLEATASGRWTDGVPDAETGASEIRVQIRDLSAVLRAYKGTTILARLSATVPRGTDARTVWTGCYRDYVGRAYDGNPVSLLASAFSCCAPVRSLLGCVCRTCCCTHCADDGDRGWLFCSETVAAIYQRFGIIEAGVDPSDVTPDELFEACNGLYRRPLLRYLKGA